MKRATSIATLIMLAAPLLLAQTPARVSVGGVRQEMLVSTEWLSRHLNDASVVVLHVAHERSDYDAAHIPGARFLRIADITVTRGRLTNELPPAEDLKRIFEQAGVGDGTRVILYGERSGLWAARAYFTLDYLGHGDRTALLDGGFERWKADNLPVSTEAPQVKPATFTPRVRPEVLVYLPQMRDLSFQSANGWPEVSLVDARPADDFSGTKKDDAIPRPGHIPGAVNLFWMNTLESKEHPEILPPHDLRRVFQQAGITTRRVVAYCQSGVQASHLYFTAKYLGYDVALYDGSFQEWSNTEGTPVVKIDQK